ncbi:MAG: hypothetical protein Q7K71_07830 [Candidatus Omnitrophota bacterium]|nr:hypothetical protein [Candidatus Omnitrophota bacterium]
MIKSISFIALLFFPVLGIAQEITAPPMVVVPRLMNFSKDVGAANTVITGKEHQNRAIAFSIQRLIDENADLLQTVQEQTRTIETLRGQVADFNERVYNARELFVDLEKYSQLRETLLGYQAQIVQRDRLLAERDAQISALRGHVQKTGEIFDQAVDAAYEAKNALLDRQSRQLIDLKTELVRTKEQLQRAQAGQQGSIDAFAGDVARLKKKVASGVVSGEEMVKMKGDMAALNYQLEMARQDLEESISLYEQLAVQHKKDIALLEEKAVLTDQKIQKAVTDARNAEKDETAERLVQFQGRLKESLDINEDQQHKIAVYKTRVKAFEKDTNAKELSASMMQAIIDQKNADYTNTTAVFTAKIDGLQERLAVAEAKLKTSVPQEDLNRIQAMLKSSREEIASLANTLKDKDAGIAKMRSQLDSNAKEFSAQLAQLERFKAQIDDSRKKIETMGKQIARLKMQLDESRKKGR